MSKRIGVAVSRMEWQCVQGRARRTPEPRQCVSWFTSSAYEREFGELPRLVLGSAFLGSLVVHTRKGDVVDEGAENEWRNARGRREQGMSGGMREGGEGRMREGCEAE